MVMSPFHLFTPEAPVAGQVGPGHKQDLGRRERDRTGLNCVNILGALTGQKVLGALSPPPDLGVLFS